MAKPRTPAPQLSLFEARTALAANAEQTAKAKAIATGRSVTYRDEQGHKRIALAGMGVPLATWDQRAADAERADLLRSIAWWEHEDRVYAEKKAKPFRKKARAWFKRSTIAQRAKASTHAVVVAWLDTDQELVKRGRDDLGERHTFRDVTIAKALLWAQDGTAEDVSKARAYTKRPTANGGHPGARVFLYPTTEPDPTARAKEEILALAKRAGSIAELRAKRPAAKPPTLRQRAKRKSAKKWKEGTPVRARYNLHKLGLPVGTDAIGRVREVSDGKPIRLFVAWIRDGQRIEGWVNEEDVEPTADACILEPERNPQGTFPAIRAALLRAFNETPREERAGMYGGNLMHVVMRRLSPPMHEALNRSNQLAHVALEAMLDKEQTAAEEARIAKWAGPKPYTPADLWATSKGRYRASAAQRSRYGGSTVTDFFVGKKTDKNNAAAWLVVEGYGPTPGDRKTYALKEGARMFNALEGRKAPDE